MERMASAQERLNEMAAEQAKDDLTDVPDVSQLVDAPVCPNCHAFNPRTQTNGGEGRLLEFALATTCVECGRPFYAIPVGWRITADVNEARRFMEGGMRSE